MNSISRWFRMGLAAWSMATVPWAGQIQMLQPGDDDVQVHVTQVDESQFPKITVYVSVTDQTGEPVSVDPERLRLAEDGEAVTTEQLNGKGVAGPLTTLLVVDVSGSMNEGGKLEAAQSAARAYIGQMRPGDQAGLLTFSTAIRYVQPITADRQALEQAIDGLKAAADTAMYDALAQAEQILATAPGRKAIIVLTDGLDNRSTNTSDQVLEQMSPSGLSISVVGLGDPSQLHVTNAGLDETSLQTLAARAGGVYGYADDPEALRSLYEKYARALQSEYVITYTSPSALRDGVKRTLNVALAETSAVGEAEYNPGGVLPEVDRTASWQWFAVALAGLVFLLLAPALIGRTVQMLRGVRGAGGARAAGGKREAQGTRVRLLEPPEARIRLR